MKKILMLFCCFQLLFFQQIQARISIALIHDIGATVGVSRGLQEVTKAEIQQLLQHRHTLNFQDYYGGFNVATIQKNIAIAYQEHDIVVTMGIMGSQLVSHQTTFPKPTIAAVISDTKLSGLQKTPEGTSGIHNFTFAESPFDIARDLQTLALVRPFEELAIVYENDIMFGGRSILEQMIANNLQGNSISTHFYKINELNSGSLQLKSETDAVYVLPALGVNADERVKTLFTLVNTAKIPSMALFGERYIQSGALIGYETDQNLSLIPRRIALNVMKIVEGKDPKDIPVAIQTYNDNLLINMATARQIGIYPDFDLMAKSTLLNLSDNSTERNLTLQSAIAEALKSNLDLQISEMDIRVAKTEVGIANSDRFPQLDVSTSMSMVDDLTALSYQGAQGEVNWIASTNVSQVIYSEPLLANIAIQKLLKKGEEYELEQAQMDLIVDVAEAYLNILQAQANLNIQQKNVEVTKENFNISKSKNAIGYEGAADLYRWEAELATKNIDLNAAFARLQQARFRLNQLLNRPIDEAFTTHNETLEEQMLLVTDERLQLIDDYGEVYKFTDFIVDFAKDKLPTLSILDNNIDVQERLLLSRERAFYQPSVVASGGANRVLGKYNVPDVFEKTANATTWNLGLGVSFPILQGGLRKQQRQQTQIQLEQLDLTRKNVQNQLEMAIRSNMENIYVSYSRMDLSREAATAAAKNFDIVQDSYNQGQVNITALIDAQNSTLQSELNANNAIYSFILDFLNLERSIGFFYFLASDRERNTFFEGANKYLVD